MKKAILVVCFGTTYDDARESCINSVVARIKEHYKEYDVFNAFSSRIIVKRLRDRGVEVSTEIALMKELVEAGYEEIIVQPLHIVFGHEFDKLKTNVMEFVGQGSLQVLKIGRPLLYFMGQEHKPDDYEIFIDAMKAYLPKDPEEGLLWVGHGGDNPGNAAYSVLQMKLWQAGYKNTRVITLESYPTIEDTVIPWRGHVVPKKVTIGLLMLVAGDHASNDIFGDEEDSVLTLMQQEGFECVTHAFGLGTLPAIADIFITHIDDAINERYEKRAKDRPEIPNII